ncbi:MAG TPA: pepsin/retropepsin-like aspartic protease family protein [Vicinamibacterales bacterium]|nr:pepsin/retropepsin-like aspartic protease family protein [Vicinamibacterales bacterium]
MRRLAVGSLLGWLGASVWAQPRPPVIVPVERASHVFFARATINEQGPFWLTVDTGATLTVIDPETAARLRLPVAGAGARRDVGVATGLTPMATTHGATIKIGRAAPFVPSPLYVVPVRATQAYIGHRIDGVLGTDFLSKHVVEFDYPRGRVVLHPPGTVDASAFPSSVNVTLSRNVLLAPASLTLPDGGTLTARLLIDTGSNLGLSLNTPFVTRHRLTERFQSRRATASVGINGLVASQLVTFSSLSIGQTRIREPEAALSGASEGLNASDAFDGILGADLLRRFTVVVDYPGRRLLLRVPLTPSDHRATIPK